MPDVFTSFKNCLAPELSVACNGVPEGYNGAPKVCSTLNIRKTMEEIEVGVNRREVIFFSRVISL